LKNLANRKIYIWLITGCVLVLTMVVVGGITRLTQSGLSMVKWEPIIGILPPLSEEAWVAEFDLYKQTPEYKVINKDFGLDDFKRIFFWEYVHRLLARVIGLVFLFPFIYFLIKGYFNKRLLSQTLIIFLGGAFQGFLGWYMVKSGLADKPHVSHYRLAAHLLTATTLAVYIYSVALEVKGVKRFGDSVYRKSLIGLMILVAFQFLYGAFVAGLKAGKIFTNFPKMGYQWFPAEFADVIAENGLWALIESHGIVQLIHRILGVSIFFFVLSLLIVLRKRVSPMYLWLKGLFGIVLLQVLLGIFTLIYAVPIWMGVLHQLIAVILILYLYNMIYKSGRVSHII
jgi:cytochrome c oxidase assembly protein subunit 15